MTLIMEKNFHILSKLWLFWKKTGYKPNLIARTLVSGKRLKIAVLLPNPEQDEYWAQSIQGIEQAEHEWAQYPVELTRCHFDLYKKTSFATMPMPINEMTEPRIFHSVGFS